MSGCTRDGMSLSINGVELISGCIKTVLIYSLNIITKLFGCLYFYLKKPAMRSYINTAVILLPIIIAFSCSKTDLRPTPSGNTENPTGLLSKFIWLDTTKSAPFDTLAIWQYSYDDQKRLIKSRGEYFNEGNVDYITEINQLYTGTDSVPLRRIIKKYLLLYNNMDSLFSYRQFDANGLIVSDSSVQYHNFRNNLPTDSSISTMKWSYENGKIVSTVKTGDICCTYIDNHFLNVENDSTTIETGNPTNYNSGNYTTTRVYDKKKNPFKTSYNATSPSLYGFPNSSVIDYILGNKASANNITTYKLKSSIPYPDGPRGGVYYTMTLQYFFQYDSNNLPMSVTIDHRFEAFEYRRTKGIYVYNN